MNCFKDIGLLLCDHSPVVFDLHRDPCEYKAGWHHINQSLLKLDWVKEYNKCIFDSSFLMHVCSQELQLPQYIVYQSSCSSHPPLPPPFPSPCLWNSIYMAECLLMQWVAETDFFSFLICVQYPSYIIYLIVFYMACGLVVKGLYW